MRHTAEFGSKIARSGFKNEQDVINKFNNWKADVHAQKWLIAMEYDLKKIESVEAISGSEAKKRLISEGMRFDSGNVKTDVKVIVTIYFKNSSEPQNISVKLVTVRHTNSRNNHTGFNQIDKRRVEKYRQLWSMPENIEKTFKYFTGELPPYKPNTKDNRRMFFNEMDEPSVTELLEFITTKKVLIITDILKGRGALSVEWVLVALNITKDDIIIDTMWTFKSINEVINHYSNGVVCISPRGSLNIARISAQRKGGDGGRETAKMLQFKFDPLELLYID